jgi:Fe-S oxidoreductase
MIRVEYPRLLGTDDARKVAAQTMDPMEFLAKLAAEGRLNKNFKTSAGKVNYHMPCHLRAQNVGYKTRDVLSHLPNTKVKVVEECSGHDGTWSMKKENFEASLKWGKRAFEQMAADEPNVACSDARWLLQIEQGNGRRTLNPMQILAKSYWEKRLIEGYCGMAARQTRNPSPSNPPLQLQQPRPSHPLTAKASFLTDPIFL